MNHEDIYVNQTVTMTDLRLGHSEKAIVVRLAEPPFAWVKIQGGDRDSRIMACGAGFLTERSA